MRTMKYALLLGLVFSSVAFAQDEDIEEMFDAEVEAVEEPMVTSEEPKTSAVDEEQAAQQSVLQRKAKGEKEFSAGSEENRFPADPPLFKKPSGPKQGGKVRVPHPNAAKGLIRINPDGSYQYKVGLKEKSQSGSFRISSMTPPEIEGPGGLKYEDIYGSGNLVGVLFDYEWQPFRSFGSLGLSIGSGFSTTTGKGRFKRNNFQEEAEESYSFFVIPVNAFLVYRFEYFRNQWVVPFINGGGTYYGLAEIRDDGKKNNFTSSAAVGGGGGVHISLSRLDMGTGFTLSEEYGVADMWLTLEARAMQGTNQEIDFTNQSINAGITVDY